MKFNRENLAPGCDASAQGIAVPNVARRYDFSGLRGCLTRLKARVPALPNAPALDAGWAFITAAPAIGFQDIIFAVQTLRDARIDTFHFKVFR
ncbi:MAG TPA: hypothetical protein VGI10_05115 [Polyangiaceae bacterium]